MEFKSEHNLDFEVTPWKYNLEPIFKWQKFRIGTCEGLWRFFNNSYEILAIENIEKGNGHLIDVFDWFENSCKRDGYSLKVLEFFNEKFKKYLIEKRGFEKYKESDVIKIFRK